MNPSPPAVHYARCVDTVARRLRVLDTLGTKVTYLDAEQYALHVCKIVEAITSAAVRVAEETPGFSADRAQDVDRLLTDLEEKRLLALPRAEDISKSDQPGFAVVVSGAHGRDLEAGDLKRVYRTAVEVLRQRDPEAMDAQRLAEILADLRTWASRLRGWLWNHAMFFKDEALIVQVGMLGTDSFIFPIKKEAVN